MKYFAGISSSLVLRRENLTDLLLESMIDRSLHNIGDKCFIIDLRVKKKQQPFEVMCHNIHVDIAAKTTYV